MPGIGQFLASAGQRLQAFGDQLQTPGTPATGSPDAVPTDAHAGIAPAAGGFDWHKLVCGPALRPDLYPTLGPAVNRILGRTPSGPAAPQPSAVPPHAQPQTGPTPDVSTHTNFLDDGRRADDMSVVFPNQTRVDVHHVTGQDASYVRTEAYDAQHHELPSTYAVDPQTNRPQVQILTPRTGVITCMDLQDFHLATGANPQLANVLASGQQPAWVQTPGGAPGTVGDSHLLDRQTHTFTTPQGVEVTTSRVENQDHSHDDLTVYRHGPDMIRIDKSSSPDGGSTTRVHLNGPLQTQATGHQWVDNPKTGHKDLHLPLANGTTLTIDTDTHMFGSIPTPTGS